LTKKSCRFIHVWVLSFSIVDAGILVSKKLLYFPNGFWENYRFYREMLDLFLILDFPDNDNLDIGRVVFYGQT